MPRRCDPVPGRGGRAAIQQEMAGPTATPLGSPPRPAPFSRFAERTAGTMASASSGMTLRFRTKVGMWRVPGVDPQESTMLELKARLASERSVEVPDMEVRLRRGAEPVADEATPEQLGLRNGDILLLDIRGDVLPQAAPIKVCADGRVTAMDYESMKRKKAFRPGGVAMGDMKRHWTWAEFEALQSAFQFKPERQKKAHCSKITLDTGLLREFQGYVQQFAYQRYHAAILYGIFREDNEIEVLASYEPAQVATDRGVTLLEDDALPHADAVAGYLGLDRVGVLMSHPPRDADVPFNAGELLLAAEQQHEALQSGRGTVELREDMGFVLSGPRRAAEKIDDADVRHSTLFTSVVLKPGEDGQVSFEAFQVSDQGVEMAAAGAFAQPEDPTSTSVDVDDKFEVIVEGKAAKEVPCEFFLAPVGISMMRFQLRHAFPRAARTGAPPSREELKTYLQAHARGGAKAFSDGLADFNLLVFLQSQEELRHAVPDICRYIRAPDEEGIGIGHVLVIKSFAGIEDEE